MQMTGYDAMRDILDINETIASLEEQNVDSIPNLTFCKAHDLLTNYRELLIQELRATPLQVCSCCGTRNSQNN